MRNTTGQAWIALKKLLVETYMLKMLQVRAWKEVRSTEKKASVLFKNTHTDLNRMLVKNITILSASCEGSEVNVEYNTGNRSDNDPCKIVAETLSKLCPIAV